MREGKPVWPSLHRNKTQRTLAVLSGKNLTLETGESGLVRDYGTLRALCLEHGLLVFTDAILSVVALYPDLLHDSNARIFCTEAGHPTSVVVSEGSKKRWLVPVSTWGYKSGISPASVLSELRSLFDYCQVGDVCTPSGLGQALMAQQWPEHLRRTGAPHKALQQTLQDTLVGGRVDYLADSKIRYKILYEVDMNDAYAFAASRLPFGTPGFSRTYLHYRGYVRAEWSKDGNGKPSGLLPLYVQGIGYPTSGGPYEGWYWTDTLEAAQEAGCDITIKEGWYWPETSTALRPWAIHMHRLRENARERGDEATASHIKRATVASIGRFLCKPVEYTMTTEPTDRPICDQDSGLLNLYFLKESPSNRPEALTHFGSYILDQCRLRLWQRARQEGASLIATNYDAIYTTREPEDSSRELGEWKASRLTNVRMPYPRAIESDQKVRLPGRTRAG